MVDSTDAKTDPSSATPENTTPENTPPAGSSTSEPSGAPPNRGPQQVLVRKQSSATGLFGMLLGTVALLAALGYPIWTPFLYGTTEARGPIPGDHGNWLTAPRVQAMMTEDLATLTRRLDDLAREQANQRETLDMARLPAVLMISSRLQHLLATDQPYDRDLRLFRMVAGDSERATAIIATLSDRAASGVPSRTTLSNRFGSVVYAIILSEQRPEPFYSSAAAVQMEQTVAGIAATIARLRWHLQGTPDGDDNTAVAIRAERLVTQGQMADAVTELRELSPEAAEIAAEWVSDVQARLTVDQAARDLEAFVIGLAARMT